ncbi:MAG: hypothetical protein IT359_11790 [Gemmatimonadaceae bacterium]|nr:hypothetical protein [Gemmatimonadaceae bacterium]
MSRNPTPVPSPAQHPRRDATPLGTPSIDGAPKPSLKDGDLSTAMEYVDFMNELGVLMQLPKRRTTASMASIPDEPTRRVRRRSSVALPAVAATLAIVVMANRLLQPKPPRVIPEGLRGEWVTAAGAYAERRLAFTDGAVGIAVRAGAPPELHPVRAVVTTLRGDTTHMAITYEQEGESVAMSLVLLSHPARELQLANPAGVVWRPAVDSTAGGAALPAQAPSLAPAPSPTHAPAQTATLAPAHSGAEMKGASPKTR